MDAALSDLLSCPRCGPTYGLVLLPYERSEGRVRSGVLGCANCRERFPVDGGVADLRVGPGADLGGVGDTGAGSGWVGSGEDPAVRLAGLMGLSAPGGTALLAGPAGAHAGALAELVQDLAVVALVDDGSLASAPGVSLLRAPDVLPFRNGSLRGVALTGPRARMVEEGARVLGRAGRLVVAPAPADAGARLVGAGLEVVAHEGAVLVAARGA